MRSEPVDIAWATPTVFGALSDLVAAFPELTAGETAENFNADVARLIGAEPTTGRDLYLDLTH